VPEHGSPLFPQTPKRHRIHRGLITERQEHIFTWVAVVVILLFATMWVGAIAEQLRQRDEERRIAKETGAPEPSEGPPSPSQQIASALLTPGPPNTAFINDAMMGFLGPLHGESGKLRFATRVPGEEIAPNAPGDASAVLSGQSGNEVSPDFAAPDEPGIYKMAVQINQATRAVDDLSEIGRASCRERV